LDEDKLATIETGAQVNVQSDWDATTGDALILNKPVITDDQQLGNFILSAGSLLSIAIERGNEVSVNLAPLLADLEAENAQQQVQIDQQQALIEDLIIRMEIREECACDPTLGIGDNTLQPDKAYLLQNIPNPFNNITSVGYFVPYTNAKAHIVISTMAGQIVHNMELSNLGVGAVSIDNSRMASGVYLYTLYVDGKRIDTKRMIVE
jgi:trimeric autotransporter adhesin